MKILRIIPSVNPTSGGPINGLINSSRELTKMGHVIHVASFDTPDSIVAMNFEFPLFTFKSRFKQLKISCRYTKWLKDNLDNYDVVIIHGLWQHISFLTSRECELQGIPFTQFVHGMLDPWFNENSKLKAFKKRLYWRIFECRSINRANAVFFTSEEEKIRARTSFSPYHPTEKVLAYGSSVPPYNLDDCKTKFIEKFPELKSTRFALFLSRIHHKKGIDLLLEAISQTSHIDPTLKYVLAGPSTDAYKTELIKQAQNLSISDKLIWVGMLEGEEKWGAFTASEVFILPSHQENFGIVVAESLASGTPVLTTNKVNIWREVVAGKSGFVEDDSVKGITTLLEKWFGLNLTEKNAMRSAARICYDSNFSIANAAKSLEFALKDVIKLNKNSKQKA